MTVYVVECTNLGNQDTGTTGGLDLLLGTTTEETSLDNDGLAKVGTLSEDLAESSLQAVNNGDVVTSSLSLGKSVELVDIDGGAVILVLGDAEVAHTELAKESGMETLDVGAVMTHTTGLTATSWMLTVLSNATVTSRDVSAELPGLLQARYLRLISIVIRIGYKMDGCMGGTRDYWLR